MKWARAKTIFIFIFLFVNIFLFSIYRLNSSEGKQIDKESVTSILGGHQLTINFEGVKSLKKSIPQFEAVQLQNNTDFTSEFFSKSASFENGKYTSESETAVFNANGISYKNTAPDSKGFSGINKHNAPSKIINYLDKRGPSKENLKVERVTESKSGEYTVSFSYIYDDYEILNQKLFVTAGNKGITEIKGPLLIFKEIKNGFYNITSWETSLIDFISYYSENNIFEKNTEITEIHGGYYFSAEATSLSSYVLPSYKITFSDGKSFYLDARNNIEPEFLLLGR